MQIKYKFTNILRALRFPFISASLLPFIFGSFINREHFNFPGFFLGLTAVAAAHLSANLINDYFDSKSRADWQDKRFFGFFGGSKLIQEGVFSEAFYLKAALFLALISFFCVLFLSVLLSSYLILPVYLVVITLSWQYSANPFRFSYRSLGEVFIFLLFGPVVVMGGYFIQAGKFPGLMIFMLSLPFAFFTLAILIANEIADFAEDKKSGKNTWPVLSGTGKGFIIYYSVVFLGFLSILLGVYFKYLGVFSFLSFLFLPQFIKTGIILKKDYADKFKLLKSSSQTISLQALISIILVFSLMV